MLPRTSGLHQRLTALSLWCSPNTESGSANVHVWGDFGRPDTIYNEVNGSVGVKPGLGGGSRTERVETIEVRVEAGIGSILLRCWIPRMREALSARKICARAVLFEGRAGF